MNRWNVTAGKCFCIITEHLWTGTNRLLETRDMEYFYSQTKMICKTDLVVVVVGIFPCLVSANLLES